MLEQVELPGGGEDIQCLAGTTGLFCWPKCFVIGLLEWGIFPLGLAILVFLNSPYWSNWRTHCSSLHANIPSVKSDSGVFVSMALSASFYICLPLH